MAKKILSVIYLVALAALCNPVKSLFLAIDPNCDYHQEVVPGQLHHIISEKYHNDNGTSVACRWTARSPPNTRIVMTCERLDQRSTNNCHNNILAISLSGNKNLEDAKHYCGKGTVSVVSETNELVIGISSTGNNIDGEFSCSLSAARESDLEICDCGWWNQKHPRALGIKGGEETGVNEFPAMAGIFDMQNEIIRCGGTILSNRYVLTAAHCLTGRTVDDLGVLVGDHNISTADDTPYAMWYLIEKMKVHPRYSGMMFDIAILRTSEDMKFSLYVGPACLPFSFETESFEGEKVKILGWGLLGPSGPKPDTLQGAEVTVISTAKCAEQHKANSITESHICTYEEGKDACSFDSGGPVFWYDSKTSKRLFSVGVISWGKLCGSSEPGVNTRVTSYISWIIAVTPDASYCFK